MSEDPCDTLKGYCPSDAVQERMAAIKAERKVKAAAEAEAFRLAIEKAKIEWEVEILMGLEDGKGIGDILALPLETWPEHNMTIGMSLPCISRYQSGYRRYMGFFEGHMQPRMYRQLVMKSTVLHDKLNLAEALDAVQMGLVPEVIDICYDGCLPLMKECAKFRLAFLRKIYPSLHEGAL